MQRRGILGAEARKSSKAGRNKHYLSSGFDNPVFGYNSSDDDNPTDIDTHDHSPFEGKSPLEQLPRRRRHFEPDLERDGHDKLAKQTLAQRKKDIHNNSSPSNPAMKVFSPATNKNYSVGDVKLDAELKMDRIHMRWNESVQDFINRFETLVMDLSWNDAAVCHEFRKKLTPEVLQRLHQASTELPETFAAFKRAAQQAESHIKIGKRTMEDRKGWERQKKANKSLEEKGVTPKAIPQTPFDVEDNSHIEDEHTPPSPIDNVDKKRQRLSHQITPASAIPADLFRSNIVDTDGNTIDIENFQGQVHYPYTHENLNQALQMSSPLSKQIEDRREAFTPQDLEASPAMPRQNVATLPLEAQDASFPAAGRLGTAQEMQRPATAQIPQPLQAQRSTTHPLQAQRSMAHTAAYAAAGRSLGQFSPSPPPEGTGKAKVTVSDLSDRLEKTTFLLSTAMGYHVRAIAAAERLDAVVLQQSDALKASARLIKFLESKAALSKGEKEQFKKEYEGIKNSFSSGAKVRDEMRGIMVPYADATRIFEHSDDYEPTTMITEWLTSAASTSDAATWYDGQEWDRI